MMKNRCFGCADSTFIHLILQDTKRCNERAGTRRPFYEINSERIAKKSSVIPQLFFLRGH